MSFSETLKSAALTLWNNPGVQRGLRVAAAAVVAVVLGFVSGPHFVDLVGTQYAAILAVILIPILSGLEKHFTVKRANKKAAQVNA